ncbi:efflux transporter outer membrane subunit [Sphingomonas crocodyli]|uniref:Efflux transporter outer membrane subunit n=1 Tax=Sphingomonas crocodyli TaxID=1979270 RepID=A0A437LVF2_9SPHN|nr:efflux transporter outer membrane subunit [Sphingomonas crocodyli]RVT89369.1 efflux transporter outer membrane subunit [Sphingomonas crocodyli]
MKRALPLIAIALLAGCSMGPNPKRPEPIIPRSWPQGDAYLRQSEATLPTVAYRDILRDPKLQAIIERALAGNQDLRIAIANVAAARAEYRVAQSDIFPQLNASGNMTKRRNPDNSSGANIGQGGGGGVRTTYQAQAGVTAWEIDLFGRLQSLSNAAFDQYLGTEAAARGVRLTLVSEVANAYLQLAADRSLLAIAKDTEASASRSVDLTTARLKGGIAPRTDVRQAETILAQARSDQARQITAVAQDRNALELLVGGPVADAELPGGIDDVDGLLAELPAGLDSGILLRRPDVVQAEYQLYAANARIGAARAAFFPRIALTALTGFTSQALSSLFQGDAFTWSVAPSAQLPIFDWGGNAASLRSAKAQRDAAVATYQKAIQTAFREVSDALARRGTIESQLTSDSQLESSARDSAFLADASYRGGIGTYLTALDSQRSAYSARRTLIATRLEKAQNLVRLYQTLGGDQSIDTIPADRAR